MKNLLLVATLALSTPSWAAMSCGAFLKTQKRVSPVARVTFNNSGQKRNTISITRDDTVLSAKFTKKFLTGLTSFFAGKSTTTSRLEERAVITERDSRRLLADSGLKWEARDEKAPGEDFTTITTYSDKFIMKSDADVEISAKLRGRKYFAHTEGETNTSNMTSVFGKITALEIKVANVAGVTADGFQTFASSVFKPRVFISDKSLKAFAELPLEKLQKPSTKEKIVDEIFALEVAGEKMNSNRDQVDEFVGALILLLEQNPNLFEVQNVVAYNRDSYSANTEDGANYQYTLDRGIRVYEPDSEISASNVVDYLKNKPLHQVEEGVAFAELKSPLIEKSENTETYQSLSYALFSRHKATFEAGKGKYALGMRTRETMDQTTLSAQLYTQGLYYFLIKGISNLPFSPDRKRQVRTGPWSIAMPLVIDKEQHRLILSYRENKNNGLTPRVLSNISLVDSNGDKVKLERESVDGMIAQARAQDGYSTITIDNQALTFPAHIDHETSAEVKDFFNKFYMDHGKDQADPRDIADLNVVNNRSQLSAYTRWMKIVNGVNWVKTRLARHSIGLVVGALLVTDFIGLENISDSVGRFFNSNRGNVVNVQMIDGSESITFNGSVGSSGTFRILSVPEGAVNNDLVIDLNAPTYESVTLESRVTEKAEKDLKKKIKSFYSSPLHPALKL